MSECVTQHKDETDSQLTDLGNSVSALQASVDDVSECVTQHKDETDSQFTNLGNSVGSLQTTSDALQASVDGVGICLDDHKEDTMTRLDSVESVQHPCGGPGWRQVVDFDMANLDTQCPSGWIPTPYSKRTCGRSNLAADTCSSASFELDSLYGGPISFSRVCGRVKAYAYGGVDAFENFLSNSLITESYVSGVSLTALSGSNIMHLWTFAAALSETGRTSQAGEIPDQCPCDRTDPSDIPIPEFVGSNYFCESGLNSDFDGAFQFQADDLLWDGENCNVNSNCCEYNRPPYFVNDLQITVTLSEIEARICLQEGAPANIGASGDDIAVEAVEIYVAD